MPARLALLAVLALAIAAAAASTAAAGVPHIVQPGETLWSIAAANNFTTRSLAAANGLGESAQVRLGQTITVPSVGEAAAALQGQGGAAPAPASAAAGSGSGGHTVLPGETLGGIAARNGLTAAALAAANGLDPDGILLSGSRLSVPGAGAAPATAVSAPAPAAAQASTGPAATPGRATAAQIGQVAQLHGVPPSLASAIGWQESGFNNAMVSSANARGVMQIIPSTWDFIQRNLTPQQLDPASVNDNVKGGVLLLRHLLQGSGGDPATAVAGYYQGASSVRRNGMFPETRRYVDNVLALRNRFGAP